MSKTYKKKVVISGDIVEIYEYENEILEGYKDKIKDIKGRQAIADPKSKLENRQKTCDRAKRDIRRIVNTNIGEYSKFVTLTFADNVTDLRAANYEWKKFKQRLEFKIGYKLQYLVVIEFQKRGAIHYHVIMFNLPYIKNKDLQGIWRNGFVKINKINNCDNVGAYVCKYLSKDLFDDRLGGQKMYFSSRGLEKPVEIKETERVDNLAVALPSSSCVYEAVFTNDYNSISYKQYNLKSIINQRENLG